MWQTKYAFAIPKNLGVVVDFQPRSERGLQLKCKVPCEILLRFIFGIQITYELFGTDFSDKKTTMLIFSFFRFLSCRRPFVTAALVFGVHLHSS